MDGCFSLTSAVCRDVRAAVRAASVGIASARNHLMVVGRRRALALEETRNALLWSPEGAAGDYIDSITLNRCDEADGCQTTISAFEWMCGLEIRIWSYSWVSCGGPFYLLLTRDADVVGPVEESWEGLQRRAQIFIPLEREKRLTREKWAGVIVRWRKISGMTARHVPMPILADFVQDRDDGQEDAALIRAAIAANFKG